MSNAKRKEDRLDPVTPLNFGLAGHKFQVHDAVVPDHLKPEELVDPRLWVSVAGRINYGDEIRVRGVEGTFIGMLFVTFKQGNEVRSELVWLKDLVKEKPTGPVDTDQIGDYTIKQKGQLGWCIVQVTTGDVVGDRTNLGDKAKALKALQDYCRALNN